jgi:hypothetical protein
MISNTTKKPFSMGAFSQNKPTIVNPMDCTFVDTSGDVDVRNNEMVFSNFDTSNSSYAYKDFGTDYFNCAFRMIVDVKDYSCKENTSFLSPCVLSTVPGSVIDILGAAAKGIAVSVTDYGGAPIAMIYEFVGGAYYGSPSVSIDFTRGYLELIVDCTLDTYGTAILRSHPDPDRFGWFSQSVLALHASVGYRYAMPFQSYGVTVNEWYTGSFTNLEIYKPNKRNLYKYV